MWDNTLILGIITSLVALIGGGGGILAFITAKQKNAHDERSSSVLEWKQLYDEMKVRLDCQEEENTRLRQEIEELRSNLVDLKGELDRYRRYDNYVYELETYINVILQTVHSMVSEEAYKAMEKRRPIRPIQISHEEEGEH